MRCHWNSLLSLLPAWMRTEVDKLGKEIVREIRLRLFENPQIVCNTDSVWLQRKCSIEDINCCINSATQYSPWTSESVTEGYITATGGHRIGICGEYVYSGGQIRNVSNIWSLCIRVAKDVPFFSQNTYLNDGSVLIIGGPGRGKTTFLRDLIRMTSNNRLGAVAVVDERREIFPNIVRGSVFSPGKQTDILSGCKKTEGVEIALRTINPSVIAVDEITDEKDCIGLSYAAWCGVRLFATAHAGSRDELFSRIIYKPILETNVFSTLIVLNTDNTWSEESLIQ